MSQDIAGERPNASKSDSGKNAVLTYRRYGNMVRARRSSLTYAHIVMNLLIGVLITPRQAEMSLDLEESGSGRRHCSAIGCRRMARVYSTCVLCFGSVRDGVPHGTRRRCGSASDRYKWLCRARTVHYLVLSNVPVCCRSPCWRRARHP